MIRVTIDVDALEYNAQGVKESLAMLLERWGDTKVVSVVPLLPGLEQIRFNEKGGKTS